MIFSNTLLVMKKYFLVFLTVFAAVAATAQSRGLKIAYIDMEYILDKVPDYADSKNQLEQKAQKWKQEIDVKRNEINKLRESLSAEKSLLTKELLEEREEEIAFMEKDLLDYQEKRFGPKGDLISQKAVLVKPIQDQVFNIIQDLSEQRKYDFVFDKSSDLTMLFAAKKHDISELVVNRLTRAANREKLSSKEVKKLEELEEKEERETNPEYVDRQKRLEERRAERQKLIDQRNADREAKRQEALDKREKLRQEREARRNGTSIPENNNDTPAQDDLNSEDDAPATANRAATTGEGKTQEGDNAREGKTTANDSPDNTGFKTVDKSAAAQQAKQDRDDKIAARKKAIEERKQKILADREAAKKAREEKRNANKEPEQKEQDEENKNEN
jgi:Skp family chaperone for outer membrane proteins